MSELECKSVSKLDNHAHSLNLKSKLRWTLEGKLPGGDQDLILFVNLVQLR